MKKFIISILVISFLAGCASSDSQISTYHLSPEVCEMMLNGLSPELFCKTKGKDTFLEGQYTDAYVDEDGCLIISLSYEISVAWKNSFFELQILQCVLGQNRDIGIKVDTSDDFLDYIKDAHTCGFDISEDYTIVIESPEDNGWYYPMILPACIEMQVFNGKSCDDIKVKYIEIDTYGQTIEEIIWPYKAEN